MSHVPVPDMPVRFVLGDVEWVAMPKRFSSGSCGWYCSTKMEVEGTRVQVSLSAVVIGSKPAPATEEKPKVPSEPKTPEPTPVAPESNHDGKRPRSRPKV